MDLEIIKEKRLNFLEEMVQYYAADPQNRRSISTISTMCYYRTEDGRKCAIGRHIPDDLYQDSIEGCTYTSYIFKDILPKEVILLGEKFLKEVQRLHDLSDCWTSQGLSDFGMKHKTEIIENFCQ